MISWPRCSRPAAAKTRCRRWNTCWANTDNQAYALLSHARALSSELVEDEYLAMRLVLEDGGAEEKEIPDLKVLLSDGVPRPAREIAGNPQWISLLWSRDRSTLSALATIPADSGATLYALLRVAYPADDGETRSAESGALVENEVRAFARYDPGDGEPGGRTK